MCVYWSSWVHHNGGLFDRVKKFRQLGDGNPINTIEVVILVAISIKFYTRLLRTYFNNSHNQNCQSNEDFGKFAYFLPQFQGIERFLHFNLRSTFPKLNQLPLPPSIPTQRSKRSICFHGFASLTN